MIRFPFSFLLIAATLAPAAAQRLEPKPGMLSAFEDDYYAFPDLAAAQSFLRNSELAQKGGDRRAIDALHNRLAAAGQLLPMKKGARVRLLRAEPSPDPVFWEVAVLTGERQGSRLWANIATLEPAGGQQQNADSGGEIESLIGEMELSTTREARKNDLARRLASLGNTAAPGLIRLLGSSLASIGPLQQQWERERTLARLDVAIAPRTTVAEWEDPVTGVVTRKERIWSSAPSNVERAQRAIYNNELLIANACWALGEIGDRAALPVLRQAAAARGFENAKTVRNAIARIESGGGPQSVQSAAPSGSYDASAAIGPAMQALAARESTLDDRVAAARRLVRLGGASVQPLADLVFQCAATAAPITPSVLGQMAMLDPARSQRLRAEANHAREVAIVATQALAAIGSPAAAPRLMQALALLRRYNSQFPVVGVIERTIAQLAGAR